MYKCLTISKPSMKELSLVELIKKACIDYFKQVIIMYLPNTVLEGDNRSYFSCGHGEHLLMPNPNTKPNQCLTDI